MKIKKCLLSFFLAAILLFSLTGCGIAETVNELISGDYSDMTKDLVQGNLDEIYLGEFSKEFLDLVDISIIEAEKVYLDGINYESEYFANYWGIVVADYDEYYSDLDADFQQTLNELYKEIYSYSKYEVQESVKQDDSTYSVKVIVHPIDIMELATNAYDTYEPLNAFFEKYAYADFSNMSDEDYMAYTHEYGYLVIDLVRDQLPNLGYKEPVSMLFQVEDIDDVFQINESDLAKFDEHVIYYP